VTCDSVGVKRNAYCVLVGKPEGKSHLEDLGEDGRKMKMGRKA
jgi:hypothetical protein